jgi:hypothetical protein
MPARHSVHESVWRALRESSEEKRQIALIETRYGASAQETLEHMMLLHGRPKVSPDMSDRQGVSRVQQLAEEGAKTNTFEPIFTSLLHSLANNWDADSFIKTIEPTIATIESQHSGFDRKGTVYHY